MDSPSIEKIKKLLSLAQSDNQNERDAALAKASAFAAEHNIDLALIDLSTVGVVKEEPIIKDDLEEGTHRHRPVERRFISSLVKHHLNVEVVFDRGRGSWAFIGRTQDVEFAKWFASTLLEEFPRRWATYKANELQDIKGLQTVRYKNTFYYGLYHGLSGKFEKAKREAEQSRLDGAQQPDVRQRYALVVQNEAKRREAAMKAFYPRLRYTSSAPVRVHSNVVYSAGRAHGATISCNRPLK